MTHGQARHFHPTDSGGHREKRVVVVSDFVLGGVSWPIEITITNRDTMLFRMLLGRTAVRKRLLVDPGRSYLLGKKPGTGKHGKKKSSKRSD